MVEGYKVHLKDLHNGGHGSTGRKRNGSLNARDSIDSSLNYLELDASDPEDMPAIDEVIESLYPDGCPQDKNMPPLVESDDEDEEFHLSGERSRAPLMSQRWRNRGGTAESRRSLMEI